MSIKVISDDSPCLDNKSVEKINKIFKILLEMETQKSSDVEAVVFCVNSEQIKKLNKLNRSIDKVTDVLSFPNLNMKKGAAITRKNYPIEYNLITRKVFIGEVFINLDKVYEQAAEYSNTNEDELYYLVTHSLLHLFGYEHSTDSGKKVMRSKEELILKKAGINRRYV